MNLSQVPVNFKSNMLTEFKDQVLNSQLEVCELGSCQYNSIEQMIRFLQHWISYYDGSVKTLFTDLGIEVSFKKIMDFKEAQDGLIDYQVIKDHVYDFNILTYECEKIIKICKATDRNDLFKILKNYSWDLWSAADSIAIHTFKDLRIEMVHKETVFGPILNQIVFGPILNQIEQSQNLTIGVQLFLLLHYKLINFESLIDFDT